MAIILFYLSLVSLIIMFMMKYFGISLAHNEVISNIVDKNEEQCHKIVYYSKNIFSKIKFKNLHKLTLTAADFVKYETIYLKRRFDSKQPAFFLSPQKPNSVHRHSVSFFIRNVTDYKNSLRKKDL